MIFVFYDFLILVLLYRFVIFLIIVSCLLSEDLKETLKFPLSVIEEQLHEHMHI